MAIFNSGGVGFVVGCLGRVVLIVIFTDFGSVLPFMVMPRAAAISVLCSRKSAHGEEGSAMRIETVIYCACDVRCDARLLNLVELQDKVRATSMTTSAAPASGKPLALRLCPKRVF
jgi:hypothetical protein